MPENKAFTKEQQVNEGHLKTIGSYLRTMGASPEQLGVLKSISMTPDTLKAPWLKSVVFLGQNELNIVEQGIGEKTVFGFVDTKDEAGLTTNHYVSISPDKPVLNISKKVNRTHIATSALSMKKEDGMSDYGDLLPAALIIPKDIAPPESEFENQYRVEEAVFVSIPKRIQEELRIKLESETIVIATSIRPY